MSRGAESRKEAAEPKPSKQFSTERIIVRGLILLLLVVVGFEAYIRMSYTRAANTIKDRYMASDLASGSNHLTNVDVKEIVGGKTPAIAGPVTQLKIPAQTYEIYVWKSLFKHRFTPPLSRTIDLEAAFSGDIPPEYLPEDVKALRKNPETREDQDFWSAYVLYVYYGPEDKKTQTREVVSVRETREPYLYEENPDPNTYIAKLPDDEGLKGRRESKMAAMRASYGRNNMKVTPEMEDQADPWKNVPEKYKKGAGK